MYQLVAFAPESLIEDLRKLRATCPRSGAPIPDCHLALTPVVDSRPEIPAQLSAHPAFSVRTTEPRVDGGDVVLPLERSEQLLRLQRELGSSVEPVVPLLRAIPADQIETAMRAIGAWRVNLSWVVRDLDAIALHEGKIWRSVARLNFGRPRPIL